MPFAVTQCYRKLKLRDHPHCIKGGNIEPKNYRGVTLINVHVLAKIFSHNTD